MSNHHSHRSIMLHHSQVENARQRKIERENKRRRDYYEKTRVAKLDNLLVEIMGVFCFGYLVVSLPLFLNYVIGHSV